ncbi:MAG: hypothetical protein LLG09_06585 [Negativicutes bacterium]|nr:hypothetical protein [Negativicutes bacterium]
MGTKNKAIIYDLRFIQQVEDLLNEALARQDLQQIKTQPAHQLMAMMEARPADFLAALILQFRKPYEQKRLNFLVWLLTEGELPGVEEALYRVIGNPKIPDMQRMAAATILTELGENVDKEELLLSLEDSMSILRYYYDEYLRAISDEEENLDKLAEEFRDLDEELQIDCLTAVSQQKTKRAALFLWLLSLQRQEWYQEKAYDLHRKLVLLGVPFLDPVQRMKDSAPVCLKISHSRDDCLVLMLLAWQSDGYVEYVYFYLNAYMQEGHGIQFNSERVPIKQFYAYFEHSRFNAGIKMQDADLMTCRYLLADAVAIAETCQRSVEIPTKYHWLIEELAGKTDADYQMLNRSLYRCKLGPKNLLTIFCRAWGSQDWGLIWDLYEPNRAPLTRMEYVKAMSARAGKEQLLFSSAGFRMGEGKSKRTAVVRLEYQLSHGHYETVWHLLISKLEADWYISEIRDQQEKPWLFPFPENSRQDILRFPLKR